MGQKAITDSAGPRSTILKPRSLNGLTTYCAKYGATYWHTVTMAKSARAAPTGTVLTRRRVDPSPPPAWIKPQLAKLIENAPDGSDWLHEIKFAGYRMHARLYSGRAQILTHRGNDWTEKYPAIGPARDFSCHVGRILEFLVTSEADRVGMPGQERR